METSHEPGSSGVTTLETQTSAPDLSGDYGLGDFMKDVKSDVKSTPEDPDATEVAPMPVKGEPPAAPDKPNPSKEPVLPPEKPEDVIDVSWLGGKKPPQKASRDLSDIPENLHPIFKNMSNSAFDFAKARWKESETLKGEINTLKEQLQSNNKQFIDSPDAWRLAPEVKEYEDAYNNISMEEQHWLKCLEQAQAGQPVQLLSKNQQTGEYTLDPPIDASPRLVADLQNRLIDSKNIKNQISGGLQQFAAQHQQQHSAFQNSLKAAQQSYFGGVKWDDPNIKPHLDQAISQFPVAVRNRTEFQMLAQAQVVIKGLLNQLNELRKGAVAKTQEAITSRSAGALPGSTGGGAPKPGSDLDNDPKLFERFNSM